MHPINSEELINVFVLTFAAQVLEEPHIDMYRTINAKVWATRYWTSCFIEQRNKFECFDTPIGEENIACF